MTNRPESTGPTEEKKIPGLTIEVSTDTNNLSLKLRAIAKHTKVLADELDEIDQRKDLDVRVQE